MSVSSHPGAGPLDLQTTRDGRPILWQRDLDAYDARPTRSGGWVRYRCPIHGGDHQQSLSLNPETGKYKCHNGACPGSQGGTLRDFWPDKDGQKGAKRAPVPSAAERGQWERERRDRADAERAARLAADLPERAVAFLARQEAMSAALRDPTCPGHAYLLSRGLDPLTAARLGVGYAAPAMFPGDQERRRDGKVVQEARRAGRVVYPLADPATGRLVNAMGRLCVDPQEDWSDDLRKAFKRFKQSKIYDCPSGVWPYASIAAARDEHRPLVLVEGPADALALLQHAAMDLPVLALSGSANTLTMESVRGVGGVVLALDGDDAGRKAASKLRGDLWIVGIRVTSPRGDWLSGAKDPAELAQAHPDGGGAYLAAIEALQAAARRLAQPPALPRPWHEQRAQDLLGAHHARLAEAAATTPEPWPEYDDSAVDAAFLSRDMAALEAAIAETEAAYMEALACLDDAHQATLANTPF